MLFFILRTLTWIVLLPFLAVVALVAALTVQSLGQYDATTKQVSGTETASSPSPTMISHSPWEEP